MSWLSWIGSHLLESTTSSSAVGLATMAKAAVAATPVSTMAAASAGRTSPGAVYGAGRLPLPLAASQMIVTTNWFAVARQPPMIFTNVAFTWIAATYAR